MLENKTIDPILLTFDVSMLVGFVFGFILALNIPMNSLVYYYLFGFGVSAITWIFLLMHFERIQKLHKFFTPAFTGLGLGVIISGFIVIEFF